MSTPALAARYSPTLMQLLGRIALYAAVALSLSIVVASACASPPAVTSPSATSARPTVSPTASATASPSPSPTRTTTPSPVTTPTPTTGPGSSPATACPRSTGGTVGAQAQLVAIRIAHQPGFDRLVFEFGQSAAPGPFAIPQFTIEPAASLAGSSGQPVTIAGSAIFALRFQNASTRNVDGSVSYAGSTDIKPTTPLLKEVRLVEDFERVLVWGAGLDHLECPKVSTLSTPFRVVADFPTPP